MITIVTSVTNKRIFEEHLMKGLKEQDVEYKLILADPNKTLWAAYNAIPKIETKYVAFMAQDIRFLQKDWLRKAEEYCDKIKDLGIAGFVGRERIGGKVTGYWLITGRGPRKESLYGGKKYIGVVRGTPFSEPRRTVLLDDMCLILPTKIWEEVKFDEGFNFHGGGFDFCLQVIDKFQKSNYVLPLLTEENMETSFTPAYRAKHGSEGKANRTLKAKWRKYNI